MARSLDIKDPQILVRYDDDEDYTWHHRILLFRIDGSKWVALTPDHGLVVYDLVVRSHKLLDRNTDFPATVLDDCYYFDPTTQQEVNVHKKRAKLQATILGHGSSGVDVEAPKWRFAEPDRSDFGQEVPEDTVESDEAFVSLAGRGLAMVGDQSVLVEEVTESELAAWNQRKSDDHTDVRLLPPVAVGSKRHRPWTSAAAMLRETPMADWEFEGPRVVREFVRNVAAGPGNGVSYHSEWVRLTGVSQNSSFCHEHRFLVEAFRLGLELDQLDLSNLAMCEQLGRRLVQVEMAVARSPHSPDFAGLSVLTDGSVTHFGAARVPQFRAWVSEQQKQHADIEKARRKLIEEQQQYSRGGGGDPRGRGRGNVDRHPRGAVHDDDAAPDRARGRGRGRGGKNNARAAPDAPER